MSGEAWVPTPEQRAQVLAEERRRECSMRGHSWDVIESWEGPVAIHCDNCGLSYRVERGDDA